MRLRTRLLLFVSLATSVVLTATSYALPNQCESLFLNAKEAAQLEKAADSARAKIVKAYVELAKATGRLPSETELANSMGMSIVEFRLSLGNNQLFTDINAVKTKAMETKPKAFDRVIDTSVFSPERTAKMIEAITNRRRLFVTTAVANTPVDQGFLAALLRASKELDAEILVFPANMQTTNIDPVLLNTPGVHIVTNTILLSPHLALNTIKILAKQINPLAGLNRMGPRGQSQIVGSPKFHVRTVPTIDNDINPHFLMTTGAITIPVYNSKSYVQERTNVIAAEDHVMGALLLEKSAGSIELPFASEQAGFFHFRHIEYVPEAKGFTDKGRFYTGERTVKSKPLVIVLPDIHVGVTDTTFLESIYFVIKKLKPQQVVLEDVFNGHSISHHERGKLIANGIKFRDGILDLEHELKAVVVFINSLLALDSKLEIRIILSNHDLWLNRWLESGEFMNEPHNRNLGLELASVMTKGGSPLEYALKKYGLEYPSRVIMQTDGSWKVAGVETGQHGHLGANGARGSLGGMAVATDRSVFGHSHTTQRLKHAVNVATATVLRQSYNSSGPSSWSHSFAAISEYGEIQLYILRHGEWYAPEKAELNSRFFFDGYPVVQPNNDPTIGQQIDQYSQR